MHLLIEAILWLLQAIFGQSEPPAKLGPKKRGQRGPYDYGDGNAPESAGGQRPKTLAELLEEARKELKEDQPQPKPRQSPPQPTAAAAPARDKRRDQSRPPKRQPTSVQEPVKTGVRAEVTQQKYPTEKEKTVTAGEVAVNVNPHQMRTFRTAGASEAMRGFREAKSTEQKTNINQDLQAFLRDLRQTRSKAKTHYAAQAVAAHEILGPPRARRPHRPGIHSH